MAFKFVTEQARQSVSASAISGHPTGVTIPSAQQGNRSARVGDPSSATGRALATMRPNTDPRRFVTHV
jgi:hypothetical protein